MARVGRVNTANILSISKRGYSKRSKRGVPEGVFRHDISIRLPCGDVLDSECVSKEQDISVQTRWYDEMTQLHALSFYRRFATFRRLRAEVTERMGAMQNDVRGVGDRTGVSPQNQRKRRLTHQESLVLLTRWGYAWSATGGSPDSARMFRIDREFVPNSLGFIIGQLESLSCFTFGRPQLQPQKASITLSSNSLCAEKLGTLHEEYPNEGIPGVAFPFMLPRRSSGASRVYDLQEEVEVEEGSGSVLTKTSTASSTASSTSSTKKVYADLTSSQPQQESDKAFQGSLQGRLLDTHLRAPWPQECIQNNSIAHPSGSIVGGLLPTFRQPVHYVFDAARALDLQAVGVRPIPNRTVKHSKVQKAKNNQFHEKLAIWGPKKAVFVFSSNYNLASVHASVRESGAAQLRKELSVVSELGVNQYVFCASTARMDFTGLQWCVDETVRVLAEQAKDFPDIEQLIQIGYARHRLAISNRLEAVASLLQQLTARGIKCGAVLDLTQCHLVGFDVQQQPEAFVKQVFHTINKSVNKDADNDTSHNYIRALVIDDTDNACGSQKETYVEVGSGKLKHCYPSLQQDPQTREQIDGIPLLVQNRGLTREGLDYVRSVISSFSVNK